MKYISTLLATIFAVVPVIFLKAQNVTSPYSILGIGDVDTKDFGRYFATGNASIAQRNTASYNFSNPASLTSLPFKTMNFDLAMRGRSSFFSAPGVDTSTGITKDFIVKRISMAFRLSQKTAVAFGLKPYSSVNYKYSSYKTILDGNTSYTKSVDGSGGINQVYTSLGRSFGKRFSAGITTSWLFGSLQRETGYSAGAIDLLTTQKETNFYNGAIFQGGLQYYSLPGKKWQHQIGLTFSAGTNLTGNLTTEYLENDTAVSTQVDNAQKFKLPTTIGVGYTAILDNKLSFSAEANYYNWPYQKVNYTNSYTDPSMRISIGMEYSKKVRNMNMINEKYYLGWGASIENSYIRIQNNYLTDYSFSFGGGYNLSRGVSVYGGFEIGNKGNKNYDQIKESYTQFILGITLKDIWIGPKVYRRYN